MSDDQTIMVIARVRADAGPITPPVYAVSHNDRSLVRTARHSRRCPVSCGHMMCFHAERHAISKPTPAALLRANSHPT